MALVHNVKINPKTLLNTAGGVILTLNTFGQVPLAPDTLKNRLLNGPEPKIITYQPSTKLSGNCMALNDAMLPEQPVFANKPGAKKKTPIGPDPDKKMGNSGQGAYSEIETPTDTTPKTIPKPPAKVKTYPMLSGVDLVSSVAGWVEFGNLLFPYVSFTSTTDAISYGALNSFGTKKIKVVSSLTSSGISLGGVYQFGGKVFMGFKWLYLEPGADGKPIKSGPAAGIAVKPLHNSKVYWVVELNHFVAENSMNFISQFRWAAAKMFDLTVAGKAGFNVKSLTEPDLTNVGAGVQETFRWAGAGSKNWEVRLSQGAWAPLTTSGAIGDWVMGGPNTSYSISGEFFVPSLKIGTTYFLPIIECKIKGSTYTYMVGAAFQPY